jgi:hypothetical protein
VLLQTQTRSQQWLLNIKELGSFLGLVGYYRKFIKNFGVISRPLSNLLKKNTVYVWTQEHDSSFTTLKQALISALVLALPDFEHPFIIETDVSDGGLVLFQCNEAPIGILEQSLGCEVERPLNL